MPKFCSRLAPSFALVLLAGFILLSGPRAACAQATPLAYKTNDLFVFAGYSNTQQDFVPKRVNGEAFGVDFTRYFRSRIAPSVEARVNVADGPLVNERTYLFGLRAQTDFHERYHIYADFLAGPGQIHYNYAVQGGYVGDNSTVYAPGAGVDIDLVHHFRAKIDFEEQYWNTGHNTNTAFQPTLLTVGVTYPIPFRPFHRQGEPHY